MGAASSPVWETRNLREVVTKLVDGSHNPPPKQETGLPMLSARNIDRGQVLFDDYRLISESAFVSENARTRIVAGDVLLTIVGTIGRTAVVPDGVQPFSLQRSVAVLTPAANLLPKFLCYQLQSPAIQKHFEANARGTAQKGVYLKTLGQTPIVLPSVDVQTEIVAELEKQFSRLDEAVANLKRVKANLKRYKTSVLKDAVEGRLVPTEAELARREGRSFETGEQLLRRILVARRKEWQGRGKYKAPVNFDSAELGELPEGWTWASIDQLAAPDPNSITDGPFGSNLKSEHYQEDGPRVIRLQNIKDGEFADAFAHITAEHFERLYKHQIHAGDLVIASLGENPPRACIIPSSVGPAIVKADCIRFKPHTAVSVEYLNAALNCQPTRRRVKDVLHGIGRPRLSLGEIRAIALPIPPTAEQSRVEAEVDRRMSLIRSVESEVDTNLKRAQALRQATLSKAFAA
ncbi:MAG: restriction endonuclease subunit S [Polaromonas sp.]|nr:restriction endonuclease subunit S [Polaromonas sp.]